MSVRERRNRKDRQAKTPEQLYRAKLKKTAERDIQELVAGHLARFPGVALSSYDVARVLGLPKSAGTWKGRAWRALEALEEQGRVIRVMEPQDEQRGYLVTRWRMA